MAALPFIAAGASLLGGVVGGIGSLQAGQAEKDAAYSEATQLEAKGKEEFAASQRDMLAKRQEGVLANSRLQALAASSGGGADTGTIIKLMSGITADSEYNAQSSLYGGKERKAGLFDAAANRRRSGNASLLGAKFDAVGKVIGGIGSGANTLYSTGKFG